MGRNSKGYGWCHGLLLFGLFGYIKIVLCLYRRQLICLMWMVSWLSNAWNIKKQMVILHHLNTTSLSILHIDMNLNRQIDKESKNYMS